MEVFEASPIRKSRTAPIRASIIEPGEADGANARPGMDKRIG
ncbi:MAG: hypothetical protein ABSB13_06360 [Candidatus Binatus sp.]|jgi:hypothetical protein